MNPADYVLKEIVNSLQNKLLQSGIMFRIFSRVKSNDSIAKKMEKKADRYRKEKKKFQDLLALRITLYFTDDVEIVHKYLKSCPNYVDESVDEKEVDIFKPTRLNLVMRVTNDLKVPMQYAITSTDFSDLIDDTYEIQIRTILSEGWHEVEHDLRYKYQNDWNDFFEESRLLNGIFASLESNEWAMLTLFNRLAYAHYKKGEWDSMLRNKMRIRFFDSGLSEEIKTFLTMHADVAKKLFRVNRNSVLCNMMDKGVYFPLTYDTVLHLLNHIYVKNAELYSMEDVTLQEEFNRIFGVVESDIL